MADESGGSEGVPWRIERLELVFYNPRHRRWQYFVEDPYGSTGVSAEGESLHRRQIRSLLKTVHYILDGLVKKNGSSISIRPARARTSDPPAPIQIIQPDDVDKECWKLYLDYLSATALPEGLSHTDLGQLAEFTRSYQDGKQPKAEITHNVALALLSLLPILDGWDTWGCILRTHKAKFEATSSTFPPAELRDLRHVCYLFDLDYSPSQDCGIDLTPSEYILGDKNRIAIQGAVCGWKGMDLTFAIADKRADFFAPGYCANPIHSKPLYRCYGALIDPILKHLYSGIPSRQFVIAFPISAGGRTHFLQIAFSSTCDEPSLKSLWKLWMPLQNVLWTPETRFFFREQLRRVQILAFQTEAKEALTTRFLQQDDITHEDFQKEFRSTLCHKIYHLLPAVSMTDNNQSYGYYEYDYRISADSDGLAVGYEWRSPRNEQERPVAASNLSNREIWEMTPRDGLAVQAIAPYEFALAADETVEADDEAAAARREPAKKIANHEAKELLDEQEEFFNIFEMYLPEEKRRRREDDEHCARIVYAWAYELDINLRRDILKALNSSNWQSYLESLLKQDIQVSGAYPPGELRHWQFRFAPESLDRYITQGFLHSFPDAPTSEITALDAKRSILENLLRPSLLLQISEYFETGPVIPLTHSFSSDGALCKAIASGMDGAKKAVPQHTKLHEEICDRIGGLEEHNGSVWLIKDTQNRTVRDFNQFFGPRFLNVRSPRYLIDSSAVDLREALRVKRFSIAGCNFEMSQDPKPSEDERIREYRFFGIDIGELLKDFSRRYSQEFKNRCSKESDQYEEWNDCNIATCKQFIPLPTQIPYIKAPWHTGEQQKTRLVHHFVLLPYKIRNYQEAEERSDLLRIWKQAGREIGELYYYDLTTVHHFLPSADDKTCGQFVPTTALAEVIAKIICNRCPKLILRFDQWKQM